ncbi:probable low-specificity L-threonine aldolase 2 [Denticeps clupeoides]|uniref:Aromatic amino acid beta-eliminating lyase/threonine aldolase domain-containing protein n=1 Tax=Denticeps clupeoides TaxID=299321 RepID=A0AAY4CLW4_9TELE|nr:probable low-specificity L-threonine aldolase 2 [Denticeps clupeoides]
MSSLSALKISSCFSKYKLQPSRILHTAWFYFGTSQPVSKRPTHSVPFRTVDLRSDSVTKPGLLMRRAMAEAEYTDDVFGDDPAVKGLQKLAADVFGMESALFVPSCTMSNLIAVMVHCRERGDEMIVGDLSHMHIYEQGGSAQLAGVHSMIVTTLPDGTFDLDQVEAKIRHGYPNVYYPRSRLVCVENSHNIQGGRVLPLPFLQELRALVDRYDLQVHMDGARVMNAAAALGVQPSTILQHCHTVSVCLSKGLGAPVGTVLGGPADFIQRALRARKALGGGLLQVSVLAVAGKMALSDMVGRLPEDHRNARTFAQALLQCNPPIYQLDLNSVETNIVCFRICEPGVSPAELCRRAAQVCEAEERTLGQGVRVLMLPVVGGSVRAVWHLDISEEDTRLAALKMQFVAQQLTKWKARGH